MSQLNEEASPDRFNCNRTAKYFIEVSDLLDQSLQQTFLNKFIKLEVSEEFQTNDQMPAQVTKSEGTIIRASDQWLRNIIDIQDPQNIQNNQSIISNPLNTTLKATEKNTPEITENITTKSTDIARSEQNLIRLS